VSASPHLPAEIPTLSANGATTSQPRENRGPRRALLLVGVEKPWVRTATNPEGQRPGIKSPPHHNSVILSGAGRALCDLRSRRTCHTANPSTPLEPFNQQPRFGRCLFFTYYKLCHLDRSAVERSPVLVAVIGSSAQFEFMFPNEPTFRGPSSENGVYRYLRLGPRKRY